MRPYPCGYGHYGQADEGGQKNETSQLDSDGDAHFDHLPATASVNGLPRAGARPSRKGPGVSVSLAARAGVRAEVHGRRRDVEERRVRIARFPFRSGGRGEELKSQ